MTTGPKTYQYGILYCLFVQNQEGFDVFLKQKQILLTFDAFFFNLYKFAVHVLSQTVEKKLVGLFVFKGYLDFSLRLFLTLDHGSKTVRPRNQMRFRGRI